MIQPFLKRSLLWLALLFWLATAAPALALTEEQKLFNEAWRIVNQSYVDPGFNHTNWYQLREKILKKPLADREQTYTAIEGLLAKLDDPFTRLLRPDQYRNLQVSTAGELSGVGLQIGFEAESGDVVVIAPIEGSPAAQAGLLAGDRILTVDGVAISGRELDEAAARMRGPRGTTVALQVLRDQQTLDFELVRDRISLNPVRSQLDRDSDHPTIGYIRLSQFNANASVEVAHAIAQLDQQGAEAFVLDLRNNSGGLLTAGIEIAREWLDEGAIVYTVNRQGVLDSFAANGQALTDKPLALLVNRGTASASEILAGALQDNERAILVGDRTFGKGLIQSLFELSDGAGLAVTVAKYETPNHHDINKQGIQPDLAVEQPEPLFAEAIASAADRQYQAAVTALTEQLRGDRG